MPMTFKSRVFTGRPNIGARSESEKTVKREKWINKYERNDNNKYKFCLFNNSSVKNHNISCPFCEKCLYKKRHITTFGGIRNASLN